MPRTISLLRNMEEKTHEKSGEVSQEKTASSVFSSMFLRREMVLGIG
jgi:hypothetical protein